MRKIVKIFILFCFLLLLIDIKQTHATTSECYIPFDCKIPGPCTNSKCTRRESMGEGKCVCIDHTIVESWEVARAKIAKAVAEKAEFAKNNGAIINPVLNPTVGSGDLGEVILAKILAAVINLFFIAGSIAVLVYSLIGGLAWITSEGDKGKMETAKNRLTFSFFGMIVISSAYVILKILGTFLGIDFFKELIIKWPTII